MAKGYNGISGILFLYWSCTGSDFLPVLIQGGHSMAKIGLQLYTVKEDCAQDFLGTIRRVAEIGYDGVEFAGFFNTPAEALKQVLDETGLLVAGTGSGFDALENRPDEIAAYCHTIGCPSIMLGWLQEPERNSAEAWQRTVERLNRIGYTLKAHGLQFLYHIHGYEFTNFEGKTGLEWLMSGTSPEIVHLELDTYWVEHGRADAIQVFRQYADRVRSFHLKDYNNKEEWHDVEVGSGAIDMVTLLREAQNHDVQWYVVEQEKFTVPPLESAAISLRNIKAILAGL
jgi:sugar phosphate isomerase/epimerase